MCLYESEYELGNKEIRPLNFNQKSAAESKLKNLESCEKAVLYLQNVCFSGPKSNSFDLSLTAKHF